MLTRLALFVFLFMDHRIIYSCSSMAYFMPDPTCWVEMGN